MTLSVDAVRETRDALHATGDVALFSHMLRPMAEHGSRFLYAPDEALRLLYAAALAARPREAGKDAVNWFFARPLRAPLLLLALGIYLDKAEEIKCTAQDLGMHWARANQQLQALPLLASISALMCVRIFVSNLLPFTSPAFAFLVEASMPHHLRWAGVFYLLLASVPAGLLVPAMDWLLSAFGDDFHCTMAVSRLTDALPFSFWVRPCVMMPARAAVAARGNDVRANAAAVLAGHFMFWAGPATTMHQRRFVPDWWTAAFVQPLGLFEDVAVVLAAWAGRSARSAWCAEMGMYLFMLVVNATHAATRPRAARVEYARHALVALCTLAALACRFFAPPTAIAPPPPPAHAPLCASLHENVGCALGIAARVALLALAFRLLALALLREERRCEPLLDDQGARP